MYPRGAKTQTVEDIVRKLPQPFTLVELLDACPGVSQDMIRHVLKELRAAGQVECLGRGPGARWRSTSPVEKR